MLTTYEKPILAHSTNSLSSSDSHSRTSHAADVLTLLSLVSKLQGRVLELEEQRSQLSEDYQYLDEQIRLASQVQRDLLPDAIDFPGIDIRTLYRPIDCVSGDIYDVRRLDETHVGISLADASGHGMPAALLTVLLKRSFAAKEIIADGYRILDPAEVLHRVNRELLETNLKQCQYVTGLQAVYYQPARTLTFARGGLCYPILIRKNGIPQQLLSEGTIIGALDEARFETMTVYMEPGDSLLFYTDGLEALLLERFGRPQIDCIAQTEWFTQLTSEGLNQSFDIVAGELDGICRQDWPADDLTMVALTINE